MSICGKITKNTQQDLTGKKVWAREWFILFNLEVNTKSCKMMEYQHNMKWHGDVKILPRRNKTQSILFNNIINSAASKYQFQFNSTIYVT